MYSWLSVNCTLSAYFLHLMRDSLLGVVAGGLLQGKIFQLSTIALFLCDNLNFNKWKMMHMKITLLFCLKYKVENVAHENNLTVLSKVHVSHHYLRMWNACDDIMWSSCGAIFRHYNTCIFLIKNGSCNYIFFFSQTYFYL
jgi:hypothetical protein